MSYLVIMRHGQSVANEKNVFTGWSDVSLTEKGIQQAHDAGKKINQLEIDFDHAHTSFLKRAIETLHIVLSEINQQYIQETKSWRLNERHYGALRGRKKDDVKLQYGPEKFAEFRRSYTTVPPLLDQPDEEYKYEKIGVIEPRGESLKMAYERLMPYWQDSIAPKLLDGQNELVVAHGSTLRALIKYLDNISDDDIDGVEVPNGKPIIYHFDDKLNVISKKTI
ncbi:2,3-bisphosphoglycerate-dependent phosphoglycerate mutase [Apilactobacillus zhangqiuensis]|uniref:2,3-bisphosphoglycerate-dependent phosphoglycerate mutase n=1 Tax=Apilactobacillus zhangqiuensis TaxID=2841031 RepID=UPI0006CE7A54|nr:2,3-diphosphoglycerate-dependent phosphoglycerate mutase [Apilactobacillus zhangqiuensis]KPN79939.1 2,3-bisphosphoglycerate-dependent phosphoglycerate mutase [Apilactobacillus kunkeei]